MRAQSKRIQIICSLLVCLVSGLLQAKTIQYEKISLERAQIEIPEEELLDIGILLFDPNIPDEDNELIFPEIRKAEARYIPYHLKKTLQDTGFWGGVWVLPEKSEAIDLIISGRIEVSNGLDVSIRIGAWDITGKEWVNKVYSSTVAQSSYSKRRDLTQDPYQNIYNKIANDLVKIKQDLKQQQLQRINEIGDIRFAAELIPGVYKDYLTKNKKNIYEAQRLPDDGDSIMQRVYNIQEREFLLLDTLNEYYAQLYENISQPYEDWRKLSREDMITYEELKKSARTRQILGITALIGAIVSDGDSQASSTMQQMAIYGGMEAMKSGFGKASEAKIYKESMKELGTAFDSEAEPLIIELEGQTIRLTGSAQEKFLEWRKLLKQIYTDETGFLISTPSVQ
ncbi:MAG TPA: hypothetical protein EYQ72_01445 [Gammaproteobacteria bacterium]|jgi:hypothetical protein|nr:hypothetical protein [Gammaproteobacteria bacterium]HIK77087.1 hypothetical protein [Gammaproteobacteria bacterium]